MYNEQKEQTSMYVMIMRICTLCYLIECNKINLIGNIDSRIIQKYENMFLVWSKDVF